MNNKLPTLVILTPGFSANEDDSTCLPAQQSFIRSMKELFPQLNIIVLSFHYPFHTKKYRWFGIEVIPFSGRNKGGISGLLRRQKIYATLKELHQTNKITGLLSFWCGECALTGKRFGDKHGIKHYCWIWGQDAKKENKYVKRIKPGPGELLALSDFIQEEFEKNHGARPIQVVPPGIDIKQFDNPGAAKDIDILGVGSLIALKQYDIFLEVVQAIKLHSPGIKAILCGAGPEKESLAQQIVKLKLQDTLTLTGELPHSEVLTLMQRTKVFLHPSSYEGFGVVCLEALYGGAAVISFCKPMQREIKKWHIVKTKEEMAEKAIEILQTIPVNFESVLPYHINDSARAVMNLFGYKEVITS